MQRDIQKYTQSHFQFDPKLFLVNSFYLHTILDRSQPKVTNWLLVS